MSLTNVVRPLQSPTSFTGDHDGRVVVYNRQHTGYFRLRNAYSAVRQTSTGVLNSINHTRHPLSCMLYPLTASQPFACLENTGTPVFGTAYMACHPIAGNVADDPDQTTTNGTGFAYPTAVPPNLDLYANMFNKQFVEKTEFTIKVHNGEPVTLDVGYAILPQSVSLIGGDTILPSDYGGQTAGTDISAVSIDSIFKKPFVYKLGRMAPAKIREGGTDVVSSGARLGHLQRTEPTVRTFTFMIDNQKILNALAAKKTGMASAPVDYIDRYSTTAVGSSNPPGVYDLMVQFFVIPAYGNRADYQGTRDAADDLSETIQWEAWRETGSHQFQPWSRLIHVDLSCRQTIRYIDPKRPLDYISHPTHMSGSGP